MSALPARDSIRCRSLWAFVLLPAVVSSSLSCAPQVSDGSNEVVRFSDVGWTDITATTAATCAFLEALGFRTDTELLSVAVTLASLENGQIDVFLGNWMPAQANLISPYLESGAIEVVGANLEGAKYTLAVPAYVAEAGLRDFSDISQYAEQLDGKIYGIEPGNDGNTHIRNMIEQDAHGLGDFELVASSEQAMLSQVRRAVANEQWIVFLGWEPHPMNTEFDMVYLSGGDESFGPEFGGSTVYTVVRSGFLEERPDVATVLRNLEFTLDMENDMMRLILTENMEAAAAARQWLADHPEVLRSWSEGARTHDGEPAWPAIQAAFGLNET